jgi:hypothetical protein
MPYRSSLAKRAKFLVNRRFSHGQAQIDHVYAWVCIIELFARSQALFPRSNRFLMGGVEEASTLQTHNTSRLRFRDDPLHFAQLIGLGKCPCFGIPVAFTRYETCAL